MPLSQESVLRVGPATAVACSTGCVLVWNGSGTPFVVRDLSPHDLRAILAAVDGVRTLDEVAAELRDHYERESLCDVVRGLAGSMIQVQVPDVRGPAGDAVATERSAPRFWEMPIALLANGDLGEALLQDLGKAGFTGCELLPVHSFASCDSPRFLARRDSVIAGSTPVAPSSGDRVSTTVDDLVASFTRFDLVISVIEGSFYRCLLDVNEAARRSGVPTLFVAADANGVVLGPTYVSGRTACFACSRVGLYFSSNQEEGKEALELFSTSVLGGPRLERLRRRVWLEVQGELTRFLSSAGASVLAGRLTVISNDNKVTMSSPLLPSPDCSLCGASATAAVLPREGARLAADVGTVNVLQTSVERPECEEDPVLTVGVIGGGTAGYFAALALKREYPHLEVTLIESSEIPIIGVGEATTPNMLKFLHGTLGFDSTEFYRAVKPTWKLGIKFFWGLPGDYYFNYPFGSVKLLESYAYANDPNWGSIESVLMSHDRAPILKTGDDVRSLLTSGFARYAYHLDNKRFVSFLSRSAAGRGINQVDAKIVDAAVDAQGNDIEQLIAADGRRFKFDLYIDCTGFRAQLIERKLGSRFLSYDSTLFTDAAVVADVPHGGRLKPYTLAESMDHGWCWNIPQVESDHRGYVFCSAFSSVEAAAAEMRRKNPGMADYWTVRFRSGRHEHFWKGNVVAIGNAYGFVEPLESTALHMVIFEIEQLLDNFPSSRSHHGFKRALNRKVGAHWDYLRWFLGVHYKFNRKFDTPFWQHCRANVDISGIEELLSCYQDGAPLAVQSGARALLQEINDPVFGLVGLDFLILGQRAVPTRLSKPSLTSSMWSHWQSRLRSVLASAVTQEEALALVAEDPVLVPTFDGLYSRTFR
jgi:tryptophan 7-halogenase